MAVSKRLRFEVLRRDGHRCRYCGAGVSDAILTVDHVTPTALGGTDLPDNLVAACEDCNAGKTSTIPDGPTIAGAADDAVRWARAIKLAAAELEQQEQPKHDYRATFRAAWERWGYDSGGKRVTFELDPEWATTMDRFRLAGLPSTVWTDIVETAMTSRTKLDNRFRYCCGIAWRMVTDMQERARDIIAGADEDDDEDSVVTLALEVWVNERVDDVKTEEGNAFLASLKELRRTGHEDTHRIIEAAQFAAWFNIGDINEALTELARDQTRQDWMFAWHSAAGEFPNEASSERVVEQIEQLLEYGVHPGRLAKAAVYAGAHRSANLYFGLTSDELEASGRSAGFIHATEVWAKAFSATAGRWPASEERQAFLDSMEAPFADSEFLFVDLDFAAAAAGVYQDADLTTCLPRYQSVFEIAARPLVAVIAND